MFKGRDKTIRQSWLDNLQVNEYKLCSNSFTYKIYFKINACIQNILIKQLVNLYCHNCSTNTFFDADF